MPALPDSAADVAERLQFLCTPSTYGVQPGDLTWSQTHMSWLFFTPGEVLKLKKAVRTPYLDHTLLSQRERDCREELRVNARLAPGVYLGLLALQRTRNGHVLVPEQALPGPGRTVDWLVRMRRLPASAQLERRIAAGTAGMDAIARLADVLLRFYRETPSVAQPGLAYLSHFLREQSLNCAVLLDPRWAPPQAATVLQRFDRMLETHADGLRARADAGCLVEGHGDLRPEHVFLVDPPVVIDALEFDPALRVVDPCDEVAFLGLECERAGAAWIGPHLLGRLAGQQGPPPPALTRLYGAARALLRARLALAHLLDDPPRAPERWPALARWYLDRAWGLLTGETSPPRPVAKPRLAWHPLKGV